MTVSDVAVSAQGLGKEYRIGAHELPYGRLTESLTQTLRNPLRVLRRPGYERFWAVRDVSFEVARGEIVGIVGRNGSGKSTLLKMLSRITTPTEGSATLYGRVGSLLEVGTGFHPELTGRENVLLNGALLGMSRSEITRKFDEIVDFAEIEKFIDTPVKRYSSGMYVRLAFAVAAHLEPEILIVDEVLAVGDVGFQRKCLGKMSEVAEGGRTVLFVSHNMAAIKNLCDRALLLEQGFKIAEGSATTIAAQYIGALSAEPAEREIPHAANEQGDGKAHLRRVRLLNADAGGGSFVAAWRQPIELELELEVHEPLKQAVFGAGLMTMEGTSVFTVHHTDDGDEPWSLEPGLHRIELTLENPMRAGWFRLGVGAHDALARTPHFYVPEAATLQVLDVSLDETPYIDFNQGMVNGASAWKLPRRVSARTTHGTSEQATGRSR